jgi:hypothetical protein
VLIGEHGLDLWSRSQLGQETHNNVIIVRFLPVLSEYRGLAEWIIREKHTYQENQILIKLIQDEAYGEKATKRLRERAQD